MKKAFTLIELIVALVIVAIVALIIFSAIDGRSSNEVSDKAIELLEQEGYHDIQLGGYNAMAGSEDDFHKIEFTAINNVGNTVNGVITGDNNKGWTIRKF